MRKQTLVKPPMDTKVLIEQDLETHEIKDVMFLIEFEETLIALRTPKETVEREQTLFKFLANDRPNKLWVKLSE